jgi:hypothetical protein
VLRGDPLPLEVVSLGELPLPLLEAYASRRWHEGVDANYHEETGVLHVLIRWGQRPSGGHRVVPRSAAMVRRPQGWQVRVQADYVAPAPGQPVIEVLTFPAAGVRIRLPARTPARFSVAVADQQGKLRGSSRELP